MSIQQNSTQFFMPTPYFAIPLGLGATAIAWFHFAHLFPFAETVGSLIGIIAATLWLLFLGLYLYKIKAYTAQVKEELECPVRFSFLSLIFITTMLVGDLLYHWHFAVLGEVMIWLGVLLHLAYIVWKIGGLWQGGIFTADSVQPPFYLPAIAANFTAASSLGLLQQTDIALFFLGAGLLSWVFFEPILLQRLRLEALPEATKATVGIVLAPPFVGSAAYLTINGGNVDLIVKLMWGYGLLQLLFFLRYLPHLTKNGFVIGLWSFSFGLASMANGAVSFYQQEILIPMAISAFVFANLVILLLCLGTLGKVLKGQFWVR